MTISIASLGTLNSTKTLVIPSTVFFLTVVHISEVANVLKHGMSHDQLTTIIRGLFMLDNVKILDVTKDAYFASTELGEELKF